MKVFKLTALVLVLVLAMIVPAFAESGSVGTSEDRTELQTNTDLIVFSRDIQEQMAAMDIKVIYTAAISEEKVEVGVYPDEAAAREIVLNFLIQNNIGEEENFEIVYSEEITTMPISTDEPDEPTPGAPDAIEEPDTPVSNEEGESQVGGTDGDPSDTEEDYVRPDDENAEIGITSVDDSAVDGELEDVEAENSEEENNNYILPIAAVLGVVAMAGGVFYFKR